MIQTSDITASNRRGGPRAVNRSLRLIEDGKVYRFSTRVFETEWLFT